MAIWQPPTENNQPTDKVTHTYFNEDAQRVLYLKERADTVDSYINQDIKTTSSPTFVDVIITGLGAIKSMITTLNSRVNQALNTTSSPTFAGVTTGAINCSSVSNTGFMSSVSVNTGLVSCTSVASTGGISCTTIDGSTGTFTSINTDNVSTRQSLFTGTTSSVGQIHQDTGISKDSVVGMQCFAETGTITVSKMRYHSMQGTFAVITDPDPLFFSKPYKLLVTYMA
ncbi:MAG: hypothetical protein GY775_17355 [Candidatus Scalindua sp.]|nr:hypothetical protein [Candidatus Scalindua sp.]